jgi:site-specific DNA-methyltransferase (adenine-specific)
VIKGGIDMTGKKSERNKTISAPLSELEKYTARVIDTDFLKTENTVTDKTINGDMLEICALLPQKSFDLVIADPPYNLRKKFGDTTFTKKNAEDYEKYTRAWLAAVKPLLKDNGSIYVCCDWESSLIIGRVLSEFFCVRNRITWQREKGRGAKANWKNGCEDIWFATVFDNYTFNLDDVKIPALNYRPDRYKSQLKNPTDVWRISMVSGNFEERTSHPAQYPEELIERIVLTGTNPEELVLDPFMGSGTTAAVAKKLNRKYVGYEIMKEYCDVAEERLAKINGAKT